MAWRYVGRMGDPDAAPYKERLPVAAGSSQTIDDGDLCELTGGNFAPLGSDKAMAAILAVADPDAIVTAGDKAGYRKFIVPRPGDLFEVDLSAAAAAARAAAVYYSTSKVVATSGSNIIGHVVRHDGIPLEQGRADLGDPFDAGTTITSVDKVIVTIKEGASYYNALQGDDA